ncbi:MAG: hypothetical protein K0R93_3667 [Anaerosolibacter sp.]|jgi:uncharacterized RDD family membrane protein YckC|uniref:RDD family protein n=1 Tax=Anaerosolibacter sp. TaxID=1872527 RepID=UPI00262CF261|nr:RDD family protein [Anaerosolibacter sp.]MDF2548769.1 hypothetical protein [Anaerosolibacter sp.]
MQVCPNEDIIKINLPFAGFWRRVFAFFIDVVILIVANTVAASLILLIIKTIFQGKINVESFEIITTISLNTFILMYIVYFTLGESSGWQGTIGKKLAGMIVTDIRGNKLSIKGALLRTLLKFISVFVLLGYLSIPFTKRRQALHDFMMKTVVINSQSIKNDK